MSIDSRVTVTGDVKLILKDGANLTVNGGLLVRTNDSFTVYAQSQGDWCIERDQWQWRWNRRRR